MLTGSYGLAIVVIVVAAVVSAITPVIVVAIVSVIVAIIIVAAVIAVVAFIGGVVATIVCTWERNGRAGNRKPIGTGKVGAQVADDKQEILAYC